MKYGIWWINKSYNGTQGWKGVESCWPKKYNGLTDEDGKAYFGNINTAFLCLEELSKDRFWDSWEWEVKEKV